MMFYISNTPDIIDGLYIMRGQAPWAWFIEGPKAVIEYMWRNIIRTVNLKHRYRTLYEQIFISTLWSTHSCKDYSMIFIAAAWLGGYTGCILLMAMTAAAAGMSRTRRGLMRIRMNILACKSACDCCDVYITAGGTCMHIKTYDTQRIPYDKQQCG